MEPYKKLMIGTMEVRQIKLSADFKYLMVLSVDKVGINAFCYCCN